MNSLFEIWLAIVFGGLAVIDYLLTRRANRKAKP